MGRVDDVEIGVTAEIDQGRVWPAVAGVGDRQSWRRETHTGGQDVMRKRDAFERERPDLIWRARQRVPVKHGSQVLGSVGIFERDDLAKHGLRGIQRNP